MITDKRFFSGKFFADKHEPLIQEKRIEQAYLIKERKQSLRMEFPNLPCQSNQT